MATLFFIFAMISVFSLVSWGIVSLCVYCYFNKRYGKKIGVSPKLEMVFRKKSKRIIPGKLNPEQIETWFLKKIFSMKVINNAIVSDLVCVLVDQTSDEIAMGYIFNPASMTYVSLIPVFLSELHPGDDINFKIAKQVVHAYLHLYLEDISGDPDLDHTNILWQQLGGGY